MMTLTVEPVGCGGGLTNTFPNGFRDGFNVETSKVDVVAMAAGEKWLPRSS